MPPRYVVVTGGVLSGLGKGVVTASLGAMFKMMGLTCTLKKLDPYLNVDPGTLNPVEHGEVFVTDDGTETDLDIGYYERFAGITATRANSTSSGKLFQQLLERERQGDFLGKTVQMLPHFTDELQAFITRDAEKYDVVLCEIGGSVGDIEAMAFYEALRRLRAAVGASQFVLVHLTYVVHYQASDEFKTKPAQNAIRELMQTGLTPDVLVCRSEHPTTKALPVAARTKLEQYCGCLVEAPNVDSIYAVPLSFVDQGVPLFFRRHFALARGDPLDASAWRTLRTRREEVAASDSAPLTVAMVGKYVQLHDAYCSLVEAIEHASLHPSVRRHVVYRWVDARELETTMRGLPPDAQRACAQEALGEADAVVVPGGFGATGLEAMVTCLRVAREAGTPTLGICLGMQLMVVEWMRHVVGRTKAVSQEWLADGASVDTSTEAATTGADDVVVGLLDGMDGAKLGGTMRLGGHEVTLRKHSVVQRLYGTPTVRERHRHRYEVKPACVPALEASGLRVSGHRDGLVEVVEGGPRYVGCQYHPEYRSSPFAAHPLLVGLLGGR